MNKPQLRFAGRLHAVAARMQKLGDKLNELDGKKMGELYFEEIAEIEQHLYMFEDWLFDKKGGKKK